MMSFCFDPRSAYSSRTRCGATCLSCAPVTIRKGVWILATTAWLKPQVGTWGARRTPVPQVAPTESEASISDQTTALAAGSYCPAQPTWRSQLAVKSARDCAVIGPALAGRGWGASAGEARVYAGASTTSRATFSGLRAAYPALRGPPCDQPMIETLSARRSARRCSTTVAMSFQSDPMVVIGAGCDGAQEAGI